MRGIFFSALAGIFGLGLLDAATSGEGPGHYALIAGGFAAFIQRFLDPTVPLIPDYSHSQQSLQAVYTAMTADATAAEAYVSSSAGAALPPSTSTAPPTPPPSSGTAATSPSSSFPGESLQTIAQGGAV
jgi:hypothetical protein